MDFLNQKSSFFLWKGFSSPFWQSQQNKHTREKTFFDHVWKSSPTKNQIKTTVSYHFCDARGTKPSFGKITASAIQTKNCFYRTLLILAKISPWSCEELLTFILSFSCPLKNCSFKSSKKHGLKKHWEENCSNEYAVNLENVKRQ